MKDQALQERRWKFIQGACLLAGPAVLLVAALVLIQTGLQLGRTFNDPSGLDTAARFGIAPDTSYPCGLEIPCYEKSRFQPIWL